MKDGVAGNAARTFLTAPPSLWTRLPDRLAIRPWGNLMRPRNHASLALMLTALVGCHPAQKPKPSVPTELAWAYPQGPKGPTFDPGPGPFHLPGSAATYTKSQLYDDTHMIDWYPNEHPRAPAAVDAGIHGSTPCAACHMANGAGFLAAPDLAGLPAAYIAEQARAFRDGSRRSSRAKWTAAQEMINTAKKVGDADLASTAAYFSGLPRAARYKVVEADMVPATTPDRYGWHDPVPGAPQEPIAGRIVEVPEDLGRMLLLDDHARILVYVPKGAVADGQALVRSGGPGCLPCTSCHGADLRGVGGTPPLAGRSAAYLTRQLWDIKTGARGGSPVALMQNVAANLMPEQIRDIAAYLASRDP
jgi:cytochrome c553